VPFRTRSCASVPPNLVGTSPSGVPIRGSVGLIAQLSDSRCESEKNAEGEKKVPASGRATQERERKYPFASVGAARWRDSSAFPRRLQPLGVSWRNPNPQSSPTLFFGGGNMAPPSVRHQDLILARIPFQMGDSCRFGGVVGPRFLLKRHCPVLEELLCQRVVTLVLEPPFVTRSEIVPSFHGKCLLSEWRRFSSGV